MLLLLPLLGASALPNVFTQEKGGLRLGWNLWAPSSSADPTHIEIELTLNGSSYIGLGFGSGMIGGTDMIIGYVAANGTVHVGDYWSTDHTTPQQDLRLGGTDDVHALSGSITWSKDAAGRSVPTTTLRLKRKLITGDRFDAVINASGPIPIVYAWAQGTPGDLRFHGDNHNHVMVDLGVPSGVPRTQFGCEEQGGGARLLLRQAKQGTLVTVQSEVAAGAPAVAPGWPYGSVADFADEVPSSGRPLLLLSHLERNMINLQANPRASLAVHTPEANCTDTMTCPRATLFGTLQLVPKDELQAARAAYLARHPGAKAWIGFSDFGLYRLRVRDVYWVGGALAQHNGLEKPRATASPCPHP